MISDENQDDDIDLDLDDDDTGDDDDTTDDDDDTTDYKAEAARLKGINKRLKTKLAKAKEPKKEAEKKETKTEKSTELDYGQKAFLRSEGIKGADEMALVMEYLASGKTLDDIVENKHFLNDLKDLREEKATKDATPAGSKRSGAGTRDSVEYWIAKGELPPVDQVELRRKVVNAKAAAEKGTKNPFYNG